MSDDIRQFTNSALKAMNYDLSEVTDDTPLGPLGLDMESLAFADLAIQVEDTFGTKIDETEMEEFAMMTMGELVAELTRRVSLVRASGRTE